MRMSGHSTPGPITWQICTLRDGGKHPMTTLESLMGLVGRPVTAADVQSLIAADGLIASTEPDLEEGELARSYLSCPIGGYLLSHSGGRVNTLFVFLVPTDEYRAFSAQLIAGLSSSSSREDVRLAFGLPARSGESQTLPILGRKGAWDRYDQRSLCIHFEYTEPEERVRQITVMTADTAP